MPSWYVISAGEMRVYGYEPKLPGIWLHIYRGPRAFSPCTYVLETRDRLLFNLLPVPRVDERSTPTPGGGGAAARPRPPTNAALMSRRQSEHPLGRLRAIEATILLAL
jgi:hypothetical protein